MKIRLEQAIFGEKDKGHALLKHSFDSSKTPNQITLKTDLPSGHTSFPSYDFYYSAISTNEYYVLIKSFPDHSAQRSGFVHSYSLFIKNSDLEYINDLRTLLDLFPNELNKNYTTETIELETEQKGSNGSRDIEQAKKVAYGLLHADSPIVWLGQENFIETITIIWNNLSPTLKSKFLYRVSFGPKDIAQTNEQIVYSPVGLRDKWEDHFVINKSDVFNYEYSNDIKYLVEKGPNKPTIGNRVSDFEIKISSFSDIKKITLLDELLQTNDFDNLLNAIALLNELLPNKETGKEIKQETIKKVSEKLIKGDIDNILSFRNIDLKHFQDVSSIKKGLKTILENWDFDSEAEQLFTSSLNIDVQKWWRDSIHKSLVDCFNSWNKKHSILFWSLISKDISNITLLEKYIPKKKNVEKNIVENIPSKFKSNQARELTKLSISREWYLIHAVLVSKLLTSNKAIESQLNISSLDTHLYGLEVICDNIPPVDFISYTVEKPKNKLVELSVKLVSDSTSLMNKIDVNNITWLEIWSKRTSNNIDVFKGVKSPRKTFNLLLDSLIAGNKVPERLLLSISNSKFSNISDYKNRNVAWNFLKGESGANILKSTAQGCLNNKLLDSSSITFESELVREIEDGNLFMNVPNKDRLTKSIIQLFIEVEMFSEKSLIAFLDVLKLSLDKDSCVELGKLLNLRKWSKAYRKVKTEYGKLNSNFKETIKISKSNFTEVERSLFNFIFGKKTSKKNMKKIFVSYSRKDVDFKNNLLTHLKPLEKFSLIKAWDCSKIRAGEWDEQIQKELEEADIMIFMISANFMASDYIIDNEVQKGIELVKSDSSKKIMCVLVRECIWNQWPVLDENFKSDGSSDLSRFQFLPYYNANGEEVILALEDWGTGDSKSVNNAYKQIVEKLMLELK